MLDKPFQYEWCFTLNASQPVKHIHQKDIEVTFACLAAQFLNHIPFTGGDFGARDTFFSLLQHYTPSMLLGKLPAGNLLHGNIIVIHLALGRHAVGQSGARQIHGQPHLLGSKISVIQPLLIRLRDFHFLTMLVPKSHCCSSPIHLVRAICSYQQYSINGRKAITKTEKHTLYNWSQFDSLPSRSFLSA